MRFIPFLFFLFLSLHSYFVFAQDPPSSGGSPQPICNSLGVEQWVNAAGLTLTNQQCLTQPQSYNTVLDSIPNPPVWLVRCDRQCTCPEGSTWTQTADSSGCQEDDLCPSGKPKVNGQCPVCIGEDSYNPDGTCKDDSTSSAASSAPSSDSASSVATSKPNDDDGDDGEDGGGGGNDNGGNNNGGGGSASSAASASSKAAGSASSAGSSGAGQCDPTAKNYLACIGSQKMDGGETAWVPHSGYGNWLPVNENSPCVNKYQDASGQWWCAAPSNNGSGTGSSSGTGTSSGAGSSAAGQCDSTSKDYLQCISSGNGSSSGANSSATSSSSANASSSGTFSSLGEKGEFDGEASEKKHDELVEELEQKIEDIKADIAGQFGGEVTGSGTIQDFCKNIRGNEVCFGMKKFEEYLEPISAAIFLVACVISFAIVLRG